MATASAGCGQAGDVHRSVIRAAAALLVVAGSVGTRTFPPTAASSKSSTSSKRASSKSVTTTAPPFTGKSRPADVSAAVRASATPVAAALGAKLGKPSCPPVERPRVGLTLQCLVAFDKSVVGWLVTLTPAGSLDARPTFPIVGKRRLESLAGTGATCDMPAFVGLPAGATVSCRVGKTDIEFSMTTAGTVQRR